MKTQKKKEMIEELKRSMGIVSRACHNVGISGYTHYSWLKKDKKYRQEVENIKPYVKDFIETALFKLIKDGNPAAVIFASKTLNFDRGYVERKYIKQDINVKEDSAESMQEIYFEIVNEQNENKSKTDQ